MNCGRRVPTPPTTVDECDVCHDVAITQTTGPTRTCGAPSHRLIEMLKEQIGQHLEAEERFTSRIQELEAKLRVRGQNVQRTWHGLVREHLQQEHHEKLWEDIYRKCCKEENMSVTLQWIHPNIRLQAPDIAGDPRANVEVPTPVPDVPFLFERLPWEIQARIFTLWLWKPGQLIHALSRLDSFVVLDEIPDDVALEHHSGLPRGFYWGKTYYNVTDDRRDPNDVLRLLLVSKRFFFIGVHCFYGLNTFAFSSLGEFDRFCNGIGTARLARIQHLELTWQGNQYLTVPPKLNKDGEPVGIPFSRRTQGLYALQEVYRLRTLVVHVNETGKSAIRRANEPQSMQRFMIRKTQGQPNQRATRALRCLQGLDCIHQLRGLNWIRFYDLRKAVGDKKNAYTGERVEITDWSFLEDITNVTTMEKMASRIEASRLENLPSLLKNPGTWAPSEEDWAIAKSYYIEEQARLSYDHLRRADHHRDVDIPSNISSTNPTDGPNTSGSDSDDSSDSDSDSDSSGGSRPKRPNRPRPRAWPSQTQGPSSRGRIRARGGSTRGAPSSGKARGGGRIRLKNPPQRHEPSLEELLIEIRNQSDSESSDSGSSESDDSDSELDSDSASHVNNSISLLSDDEDDNNTVIVVDDSDSSDSSDDLFVRQSTGGGDPNSPGPGQAEQPEQPEREDSVIPIPWSPSLANTWSFNLPSRPQTSRGASGNTITPRPGDRRRDSASSGLFVSQSPAPSGELGGGNRSPSVKSENPPPLIMPDRANEMIDLTSDEMATLNLAPIMEIDDDEDDLQVVEPPPNMEIDEDNDSGVPEVIEPPSPTGSKRSNDDCNTSDEGDDSDAPSPPKRPRTSSPRDRPADGDSDVDDDSRAASV